MRFLNSFISENKNKYAILGSIALFVILITFLLSKLALYAQTSEDCLACHAEAGLTMEKKGKTVQLTVNKLILERSAHGKLKCAECHVGFDPDAIPHLEVIKPVSCNSSCHPQAVRDYADGLHGKAHAKGDPLAPDCKSCHGTHNILKLKDPNSEVSALKIPFLCGKCHREGSPVQLQRHIPQTHILENYTESIHGEGLLKKGLVVTATCASCHTPHLILPHTDPRSSIARSNIASTCIKCHAKIENVHQKVINGELWKKERDALPACVDCHQPHKIRQVFYEQNLADASCKKCHENSHVGKSADGKDMFVSSIDVQVSVHAKIACVQCHVGVDTKLLHLRPCKTISQSKEKVNCTSCHDAIGKDYYNSMHGRLSSRGDKDAPICSDCHGKHKILPKTDQNSITFPLNIPKLCSSCHQEGKRAAVRSDMKIHEIVNHYSESIHGKGLIKSGLTVTATCADCHTAHNGLPAVYPESSINSKNISNTCGKCHFGIQEHFDKSVHSPLVTKTNKKLPVCNDCHSAHTIKRTDQKDFRNEILSTCGKCHEEIATTYFDTYHGKVSRLGLSKAAKCSDCHGSHDILPPDNQHSTLSRNNIIGTCKKCHPNANKGFTRYLTHATHHDPNKYPILFISFWGMTALLLGTFFISFLHTLLWLPRSIQMRKKIKQMGSDYHSKDGMMYSRFTRLERTLHFIMIISFLTLAVTGLTLKFSYTPLSQFIIDILKGAENAGLLHRIAATALFGIFITHVTDLFRKKKYIFGSWKDMLIGPDSMIPNKKDWEDLKGSLKWFIGIGERPNYGKWTYWEKFDYFAVFWGVFVIGSTGLTLWFPEFFTNFFPGWALNVATIIHSDEALLAAGFIFTIHFFNTHFRPEKFPMDTVIFSGQMSIEELKFDRPAEFEAMVESGRLDSMMEPTFSPSTLRALKVFGFAALVLGLSIVIWIILAFLLNYK